MVLGPRMNAATRAAHKDDTPEPMVPLLCKDCGKPTGRQVRKAVVGKSRAICGTCYYKLGMKPQPAKNQKVSILQAHDWFMLRNMGIGR